MSTTANKRALLRAVSTGDLAEVQRLVNVEGADIECRGEDQWTPLHKAAHGGHADVVRFLLTSGADATALMPNGQTLLASVIQHDQFAIADILYPILYPGPSTAAAEDIVVETEISCYLSTSVLKATYHGNSVVAKCPKLPTPRTVRHFRNEVETMQSVSSAYVQPLLAVLDNGTREPVVDRDQRNRLYSPTMITDYMDQGDLHEYLKKKGHGQPVALDVSTLDVALVLAHALADLHRQNIVHRDVNSLNIFLSTTHYIRLGDVALARTVDVFMTTNVGTPSWMAPEIMRSSIDGDGNYTTAADIYSFGVVLTELDTLHKPYNDVEERWSIMEKVRTGQLRPRMSDACPQWLKNLADQCLSFYPTKRPTAKDIIDVLLAHRNEDDRSPSDEANITDELLAAVRNKDVIQTRHLCTKDFDPDVQDDAGLPLLHLAVDANTPELLADLLASAKLPINGIDPSQSTALDRAVRNQNVDAALALVLASAKVQSLPQARNTYHRCMDALVTFVQTIGARAFDLSLLRAASDGNTSRVDRLLRAGAQCTHKNNSTESSLPNTNPVVTKALVSAVLRGHVDAVQCLLDLGADVSTTLPKGQTLLAAAVQRGHYQVANIVFRRLYPGCAALVSADSLRVGTELRKTCYVLVAKATLDGKPFVIKGPNGNQKWLQKAMLGEVTVMKTFTSPYLQPLIAVLDDGSSKPHVAEPQSAGDQRRNLYNPIMVMENMDLGDLLDYLKRKRNNETLAMDVSTVEVALVLAHALADLHRQNIIHRDVKSQNIFLSTTHYIRLGDVGSARTVDESMTAGVGTTFWMAPEVLREGYKSKDQPYTITADIYSFGVVLTELDTLDLPYEDEVDRDAIPIKVRNGQLRPHMSDACPQWLRDLANQCLSLDPTERPTAEDIIATLLPHHDTTRFDLFDVEDDVDDVEEPSDALSEERDGVEKPSDALRPINDEEEVETSMSWCEFTDVHFSVLGCGLCDAFLALHL